MNPVEAIVSSLGVIFFVAFLVESLVEYLLGIPFDKIEQLKPYKWILMYASSLAGIGLAWVYQFDLIALLGQFLGVEMGGSPVGVIVTGLAIGRGANYLHDLVGRYFVQSKTSE